jgi:hypothetical protein
VKPTSRHTNQHLLIEAPTVMIRPLGVAVATERIWSSSSPWRPVADPNADAKFDHSEKVIDAQMRIAEPVNTLKLVAPPVFSTR